MFKIVTKKKNQAMAFVDIKKRLSPTPICLAIGVVCFSQVLTGMSVPTSSHNENFTFCCWPFSSMIVLVGWMLSTCLFSSSYDILLLLAFTLDDLRLKILFGLTSTSSEISFSLLTELSIESLDYSILFSTVASRFSCSFLEFSYIFKQSIFRKLKIIINFEIKFRF